MNDLTPASNLAARCRAIADVSQQAVRWLTENKEVVRQQQSSLLREFRKFATSAQKLAAAVERPMCVGVFGPSQAGKSYLISALARKGTNALLAEYDGFPEGIDFVRQINPEGGAESTGLVTRFSMNRKNTPSGFPVFVRLLSQSDLVKIFVNTYFSDCDLSEEEIPDAAKIQDVADAVRRAGGAPNSGSISEDDVWTIQDYVERGFRGEQRVRALSSSGFWEQLSELAPRLPVATCAPLFAILWGEVEPFTNLFVGLSQALGELGNPAEAFCSMEALVRVTESGCERRADSVIDVNTLHGLGASEGESIPVRSAAGKVASIPRPVLTALISEMHVVMREQSWDFFAHTDLLDFPGARSRENVPDIRAFLTKPDALESLFLRGKVAYLFDRYNAEQELTAMLLCISPSNQEVRTLPGMVKDWIDATHGADPAARANVQTALFLVLTKFDAEFEEAAGKAEDSTARWTRRLHTSLIDFFGKAHDWPHEWTPGHPFNNTYWLRNPNFLAKHILDYDSDRREIGLRTSEVDRIAKARAEFIENADVQRHFRDPATAWDEAFRLNDGGITYLAKAVAPVCNTTIKTAQIDHRLAAQRRAMHERLQKHYVGGDLTAQRERRHAVALEVVENLIHCAASQRFGRLIRSLQVSDSELSDAFFKLETQRDPERVRTFGVRIDEATLRSSIGLSGGEETSSSATHDRADDYARTAIEHWVDSIRSLADSPRACRYFRLKQQAMADLVDELVAGANRLDIQAAIANRVRPALSSHRRAREIVIEPAFLAADTIGSFVMWLGYSGTNGKARPPRRDDPKYSVFEPRQSMDFPVLSEQPASFDRLFYRDWFTAFIALVEANAASTHGHAIDLEKNAQLGVILTALN